MNATTATHLLPSLLEIVFLLQHFHFSHDELVEFGLEERHFKTVLANIRQKLLDENWVVD